MSERIFIVQGDISRIAAEAVAYSTDTALAADGYLYSAFQRHIPGFEEAFAELRTAHGRRSRVGEAFWLPLADQNRGRRQGVVVTPAVGARGSSAEQRAAAVVAALTTAMENVSSPKGEEQRPLIALPTFGFGMGGDRRRRLESARAQLQAAHDVLARNPDVDATFVAYTADSYQILLRARRELGLAPDSLPAAPAVEELTNAIRKGECVIFAGAGLSQGAGLPGWEKFIHHLADDLGAPAIQGLEHFLDVAQWYVEQKGEDRLAEQIRSFFGPEKARPTLPHYALMSLPVRVVVTTNYDDLLEQSLEALRRYPTVIKDEGDVANTGHGEGVSVVKMHGDAATSRRFVLSRDDFDRFLRQRPAMSALLEGLLLNHSFFFVGYGLRDPNFRQLYGRIADMLQSAQRKAFAVMVDPPSEISPFVERQWANKGVQLISMPGETLPERVQSLWRFLDRLAEAVSSRSLFLTDDVEFDAAAGETPRLETLRGLLRDEVGCELEAVLGRGDAELTEREARLAAEVLGFLMEHGWRPKNRRTLAGLWEQLAGEVTDEYEKKRLLIRALRYAEQERDIARLRRTLAELEEST